MSDWPEYLREFVAKNHTWDPAVDWLRAYLVSLERGEPAEYLWLRACFRLWRYSTWQGLDFRQLLVKAIRAACYELAERGGETL
jgi:hypothetical protein